MADSSPPLPSRTMSPPPKRPTIDTTLVVSSPRPSSSPNRWMVRLSWTNRANLKMRNSKNHVVSQPSIQTHSGLPPSLSVGAQPSERVSWPWGIEHLQHYFTKTGLQSKHRPMTRNKGLVPAVGGKHVRAASSVTSIPELPPSPMVPISSTRIPFVHLPKSYHVDSAQLKPGVIRDLKAVEQAWRITPELTTPDASPSLGPTTQSPTQRKIRLSWPRVCLLLLDEEGQDQERGQSGQSHAEHRQRPRFTLQASSERGPGAGVSTQPFPSRPEDPVALVRRAALDVLISLRSLEEKSRIVDPSVTPERPSSSMLSAQPHDQHSASSRSNTPAFLSNSGDEADKDSATSFSQTQSQNLPRLRTPTGASTETVLVHGRGAVQVWSESDEEDLFADEPEKKEVWDERLVLGGGWLYRPDLAPADVHDAKTAVGRYLDVVDALLFRGRGAGRRGWDRERRKSRKSELASGGSDTPSSSLVMSDSEDEVASRRVSDTMKYLSVLSEREEGIIEENEEEEEEEGMETRMGCRTGRVWNRFLIRTNDVSPPVPSPNRTFEPHPPCADAGNPAQRPLGRTYAMRGVQLGRAKSKKAWGFINAESIHETALATSEERAAGSWTFRRRENLGLWAAALKLRYVIDIVPVEHSTAPTRHFHQAPQQSEAQHGQIRYAPNQFSPIVVAKHEAGWEDMLERAMWEWVNAVVTERKAVGGQQAPQQ
ncbi:hypothetical protein RHS01_07413 [Rhizoctonia solani]|uniref:Uncharacterized protein n=1 Tax=Rhizoctonia solani TaxID=456999 RepID=A0A8H7IBG2_9AGAM|nr:hypothetical protein RHS01_07413 [Rhizoctonia solani]